MLAHRGIFAWRYGFPTEIASVSSVFAVIDTCDIESTHTLCAYFIHRCCWLFFRYTAAGDGLLAVDVRRSTVDIA
jgi:hypothetical protein